jgi:hypothetical protein
MSREIEAIRLEIARAFRRNSQPRASLEPALVWRSRARRATSQTFWSWIASAVIHALGIYTHVSRSTSSVRYVRVMLGSQELSDTSESERHAIPSRAGCALESKQRFVRDVEAQPPEEELRCHAAEGSNDPV